MAKAHRNIIKPLPFFAGPWPVVIGHRGAAGTCPENTVISFSQALAEGADIIECDLHLSRDGIPVIIHDETVNRTTNGTGRVNDLTLAELQKLDAGYRFTTYGGQGFPYRGQDHMIPTLEDVLDIFPETRFCLELKDKDAALVERVIDMLIAKRRTETVLLATFDFSVQRHIYRYTRQLGANIAVTASNFEAGMAVIGAKSRFIPPPRKIDIFALPPKRHGITILTEKFSDYIHRHNRRLYAWTIDDPAEMKALLDQGVDGIATNYPARALPLVLEARTGL